MTTNRLGDLTAGFLVAAPDDSSTCEHCGEPCEPDTRFCNEDCLECEHLSTSPNGCDQYCYTPGVNRAR